MILKKKKKAQVGKMSKALTEYVCSVIKGLNT